jgi:hypothetical protein
LANLGRLEETQIVIVVNVVHNPRIVDADLREPDYLRTSFVFHVLRNPDDLDFCVDSVVGVPNTKCSRTSLPVPLSFSAAMPHIASVLQYQFHLPHL